MTGKAVLCSWSLVAVTILSVTAEAKRPSTDQDSPSRIGNVPAIDVLRRLGARLEQGATVQVLNYYSYQFDRMDTNRDGKHTRVEYVDRGRYMTPQARSGIFRAADGNLDGVVTKSEYLLNRIITDEAKVIIGAMDDNSDGVVERLEFIAHSVKRLSNRKLAEQCFSALDVNSDGVLYIPEYLRIWGLWARADQKSAETRIAARRTELAAPAQTTGPRRQRAAERRPGK